MYKQNDEPSEQNGKPEATRHRTGLFLETTSVEQEYKRKINRAQELQTQIIS